MFCCGREWALSPAPPTLLLYFLRPPRFSYHDQELTRSDSRTDRDGKQKLIIYHEPQAVAHCGNGVNRWVVASPCAESYKAHSYSSMRIHDSFER
jgi:hypothetical protein